MTARSLLLVLLCGWMASAQALAARTWTDRTGKYRIEAEFVDAKDGKVRLRKTDGKVITLPLEKLSSADRQYVKRRMAETAGAARVKPPRQTFKLAVPEGWKIVKHQQAKNHAWWVLQKEGAARVKPTVAVWSGHKFINDAPPSGKFKAGNTIVASIWASRRAMCWALGTPGKDPPKTADAGRLEDYKFGGVSYIGIQTAADLVSALGLSTCSRPDGALTVGCACPPAAMPDTIQSLEKILGKRAED